MEEKTRILKLQEDYSTGKLKETSIPREDVKKLKELYKEQLKVLDDIIEGYKKETKEKLEKLKRISK